MNRAIEKLYNDLLPTETNPTQQCKFVIAMTDLSYDEYGEILFDFMDRMGLPRITKYTITNFIELENELKLVKENGYGFDRQEMRIGVSRIAAPVCDQMGKIVACLGVAGPSFRITSKNIEKIAKCTKKLAEHLSGELIQQAGDTL